MNKKDLAPNPQQVMELAEELFRQRYCCSEAVLLAVARVSGIQSDLIPGIATGFCGGMGRTGNVCGAVTGAILAISLVTGRNSPDEPREQNQQLVRKLLDQFQKQFGALECESLIGVRLDTQEGHRLYVERNLRTRCTEFVRYAARLAAELIAV